jgi:hypothetical protein
MEREREKKEAKPFEIASLITEMCLSLTRIRCQRSFTAKRVASNIDAVAVMAVLVVVGVVSVSSRSSISK